MANYRLYPSTNGPGSSSGDGSSYVMGVAFQVTQAGMSLDGYWFWVADASQNTLGQDFAIWFNNAGTISYVTGSKITSGALSLGWNYVPYVTPLTLLQTTEYRAVTSIVPGNGTSGYSATANFFSSGPGSGGITNGPLFAWSGAAEPHDGAQMAFSTAGTDVTTDYPTQEFNQTNYWLDIQVDDGVAPPSQPAVLYQMRTFP